MAAGSTKLLAASAACAGVVALALWSTMSSDARVASEPLANSVAEPKAAEDAPRMPASALAASEETNSTRRVADRPEIVGTLIATSPGLPLAGYPIEMRPRVRPNARVLVMQQLLAGAAKVGEPNTVFAIPSGDYTARIFFEPANVGRIDVRPIVNLQVATASVPGRSQPELKLEFSPVVWFAHGAASGANPGPQRFPFGVTEPETDTPESVTSSEAPAPAETETQAPAAEAVSGPSVQVELPLIGAGQAAFSEESLAQLRVVQDRAVQNLRLQMQERAGSFRPLRSLVHSPWSSVPPPEPERTTTDAQGVFRFECPDDPDIVLELVPHERDFFSKTTYTAIDPARVCQDELVWRVERADGALVHGRVVDAQTLRPIAGLTLELRGERATSAVLVTDDEGRFTTDANFPAGVLQWSARDGDDPMPLALEPREVRVPRAREANDERLVLASIGPTWRMSFQTSESAQVGGETTTENQEFPAAQVELRLLGAQPIAFAADESNPFAQWRALREGDPAGWVRYPRAVEWSRGGSRAEFRSSDGSWTASMPIRAVGALTDLEGATIVLRRSARLTGVVKLGEHAENGSDASDLRVLACRTRAAESAYESSPCESCGSFVLEGLDPQAVRWLVVTRGESIVHVEELVLQPGDDRALEFEP